MLDDKFEIIINDGARHFVDLPELIFFDELYEHVEKLEGAEIIDFEMDGVLEMWLDFEFRGHEFFVKNQLGDYQFFVADPDCPDEILLEVIDHFRKLLER